ncbi:MAG: hypothetical protein NDI94_03745 [Candidatus Woesearchaeota archaeon]|nr:hypothetical protein [Candidatus Woesearchaeota archaeon]
MFDISKRLLYYKRKDVGEAIISNAKNREVGIRYGTGGYGKRPDILMYPTEVLDAVKRSATSFHVSEERWENPLELTTEMKRTDQDNLRIGWDLVLDIDCPYWPLSKTITHLFIKSLKSHGIKSVSCKFSGNKGFHIGVPFEAFPKEINNIKTKDWFPEGPKKIALYLMNYISDNFVKIEDDKIFFDGRPMDLMTVLENTKREKSDLFLKQCIKCKRKWGNEKTVFICTNCDLRHDSAICQKCGRLMGKHIEEYRCTCGSVQAMDIANISSLVEVDTVLIASRHLYRSAYSMNEKSGLISLPINPDEVLNFEKESATSEKVNFDFKFLDTETCTEGEAAILMVNAFDFGKQTIMIKEERKEKRNFEEFTESIPIELFPPCVLKMLEGLEDGKKRSLFVLTNFLKSANWNHDQMEDLLLKWNAKNKEPLKDGYVESHLRYHKQKKDKILPPNCRSYYADLRVCSPDAVCARIKNPVQYSKRKLFFLNGKKAGKQRLSEEQKAMRKQYREKLKKAKEDISKNEDKT